jgi:adenosylcobinamide-GDP ribazoletransferase
MTSTPNNKDHNDRPPTPEATLGASTPDAPDDSPLASDLPAGASSSPLHSDGGTAPSPDLPGGVTSSPLHSNGGAAPPDLPPQANSSPPHSNHGAAPPALPRDANSSPPHSNRGAGPPGLPGGAGSSPHHSDSSDPSAQLGGGGGCAPRHSKGWGDGLRLSFGTLTVLPAGVPGRVDREVGGRAMVLAPVVGVVLGGIAAGVVALAQLVRPDADLLAAVLGVLVIAGLSGGLHLDGLADFADALGSRRDRETMLRIMKQSDIGPFGVVAIVGVLLVDVAALTACLQAGLGWQALLIATIASRLTLAWSCRTAVPPARPDGLGTFVAGTVRPLTATLATTVVLAAALALTWLTDSLSPTRIIGTAAAVLLAVATSLLTTRRAQSTLGGTTGDVLGAIIELALPVALLTLALTS